MKENSKGKTLCENELESVAGGVGNISGNFGNPIYGKCEECGKKIIVGEYGVNKHFPKICLACRLKEIHK